jgi:hypothetical protein
MVGSDEAMPVEESGNMLIMTLSYTQATNDQFLISTYVRLPFTHPFRPLTPPTV